MKKRTWLLAASALSLAVITGCATSPAPKTIADTAAATPRELYRELQASHPLELPSTFLQVAINARYATLDTPLNANDRVVFIPPVAGG